MSSSVRIAISGGGAVATASLLHALVKFSHLDVHVFEPTATVFENPGSGVGVARNGMTALELISMAKYLRNAEPFSMKGATCRLGQGPNAGNEVFNQNAQESEKGLITMTRPGAFLQQLRADLPQERLHASKRLFKVDRQADDGSLILHFTDETTHECDILIGADGIQSTVRKFVLGDNEPTALPRNTGYWAIMAVKPYEEAQASFGKDLDAEDPREIGWIGDNTFFEEKLLNEGQNVSLIICSYENGAETSDRWDREVPANELREVFQQWMPRLSKAVDELLCSEPKQPAMYFWEHPDAPSYVSGPICVMGDAAHATTPWQSGGVGMNFEDILVLSTLLGRSKSPTEAQVALKVYDRVRRPRTQAIVRSSRETGEIITGRAKDVGLDPDKLRESLVGRWDFILDFDLEKHRDQALEMMEAELGKAE